ncbi:amino acid transporter [Burkholderia ubonensis]|uniref:Amino acid transporter n=1 Tax=Burkholderia ubonensis TaxID=101571 RepID=A0AB73G4E4_9BURK|nr:LysE family translocator [Burkholderia ubonensis]KVC78351.1 amino acid transporter [Burkholderia ubonensis]KVK86618.1 amino acid transporter [Burkholderia ubonensis]KVL69951.1 amino acid transporter [Burkholderia ubonensis]KVM30240.1 amino acid transporter [Burkholderia ubonensis]KVM34964.1 amino acid transporter [Burkholderia ubonensis]
MSLHTWWLFVATVFVVSAIPGPNMLLVMTHGARHGLRRSSATMAGCLSALVLMLSVSAAGLGVFLEAWPAMFNALRYAGAAYLVYLGVKAWRARVEADAPDADVEPVARQAAPASRWVLFRNGFLVAGSNPKAILFAAALLPQFINASEPTLPQFGVLVATFAVIEVSWYLVYALFGTRIGATLKSQNVAKAFNRLTGGLFVGFGAMMALVRH